MPDRGWAEKVLSYWYDELGEAGWYSETPAAIDAAIRERFLPLYEELAAELPAEAWTDPDAALAAVLVLDQFPRNMFRGQAQAFATDTAAAALSRHALEKGLDAGMPPERKQFLFMPLMHSELAADQAHSVALFEGTPGLEEDVRYAVDHRDIIAKFGRFPHRNRALGRASTEAEQVFLGEHKGFGQ